VGEGEGSSVVGYVVGEKGAKLRGGCGKEWGKVPIWCDGGGVGWKSCDDGELGRWDGGVLVGRGVGERGGEYSRARDATEADLGGGMGGMRGTLERGGDGENFFD